MSTTAALPLRHATGRAAETRGMLLGLAGVAIFSLTLPCTRLAVASLDPAFVALGRALLAALLAGGWLAWQRAPLPPRQTLASLTIVSGGCVIGFPWLTSIAMRSLPASHGAVLVGVLPLATAVFSALRAGERPSAGFWSMAVLGSALVVAFALRAGGGRLHLEDGLMLVAVLLAGLGYAEGGRLSRRLGGMHTISWGLLVSVPVLLPVVCWTAWTHRTGIAAATTPAWFAFAYLAAGSMFIGMVFWYRGLALGGIARVGQVQLLQPFLSLLGAWAVLGEPLSATHLGFALAVLAVVAAGRRMQVRR